MAKLFILLLMVWSISAMPVADEERKEQPSLVVPLEKNAENEKPLEKPIQEIKAEPTLLPDIQPKNIEDKTIIPEEPILKKTEEEPKKIEEPSKVEEKKPEPETKPVELKKEEPVIQEKKLDETPKPELTEKQQDDAPIPEAPLIEKKIEEPLKPVETVEPLAKEAPIPIAEVQPIATVAAIAEPVGEVKDLKDQRVMRGTEEIKPIEKKEESPVTTIPLATEEKTLKQPVEETKVQEKIETGKTPITEEPKKDTIALKEQKPTAIAEPTNKPTEEPLAPQIKQAAKPVQLLSSSPVQETHETPKEQRSEDSTPVMQEEAKAAPVVPKLEVVEEKVAPVQSLEKVAKSVGEPKAEELPKPQEVKETKTELPKSIETEPILKSKEEEKPMIEEEKPLADAPKEEPKLNKEEEKKKDSSEEASSEEQKLIDKKQMEKKDSSEKQLSSEEMLETKKKLEEKKEEVVKTMELPTLAAATS